MPADRRSIVGGLVGPKGGFLGREIDELFQLRLRQGLELEIDQAVGLGGVAGDQLVGLTGDDDQATTRGVGLGADEASDELAARLIHVVERRRR